jgi:hypothetical protein
MSVHDHVAARRGDHQVGIDARTQVRPPIVRVSQRCALEQNRPHAGICRLVEHGSKLVLAHDLDDRRGA